MNINKKMLVFYMFLLILGLCAYYFMPQEETNNTSIGLRIGAGDDITGLLLKQIIRTNKVTNIEAVDIVGDEDVFHDFTFKDC
ncbi:hypothetical protein AAK964_00165 [Tissierella praeacuta]|nr:hypothetical protein [Tissierella praeacuta]MBU5255446.1 hypothetical protein [Tissierella praeacuta]